MLLVGLTGSLAMGKSETAAMFRRLGVPVFDADEAVHQLYAKGGAAVAPLGEKFPSSIVEGAVDRGRLARIVLNDPEALEALEAIVHPLVRAAEWEFIAAQMAAGRPLAVLDIPLLFETERQKEMDAVVVVTAPADIQRARALRRPGMTEAKLSAILSRQLADSKKRKRGDFVIDTSSGFEPAFEAVRAVVDALLRRCQPRNAEP